MRCPSCRKENTAGARFCSNCGRPLARPGAERKGRGKVLWPTAVAALAVLLALWWLFSGPDNGENTPPEPAGKAGLHRAGSSGGGGKAGRPGGSVRAGDGSGPAPWVAGEVSIDHHLGLALASVPGVVVSGGWVALPVRSCYGGDLWRFRTGDGRSVPVTGGLWRDGDPVALWQLEEGERFPGPDLAPWRSGVPLTWRPLDEGGERQVPAFQVRYGLDRLIRVPPEVAPPDPGLFLQEGRAVGWTFGDLLDGGLLWNGPPGKDLASDIRVDHFYSLTFANGREERFIKALSMGEGTSALARLKAFAEGFGLRPELQPEQTPPVLAGQSAAERMRALAAELVSKGMAREAADLLDRETLIAAGDERLVIQALKATAGYYGPSSAVDLAEDVLEHLDPVRGPATAELKGHIKGLYMDWIRDRMDQGDTYGAWRAHKRSEGLFPEDPELRLLGIEIALEDGDWRTADRLLSVKRFPRELAERAARLTDQVDELRSEEGKIVIRFQPGLRHIPVRALINGSVEQDFVIDTGASLVTIPSITAHALDLRMDGSTPQRWISTAGGPALAREVTLAAITLKGREVNRVKAWVLDIPGRPRMGLLGLNYLNRFHVEIDSDRGVLMLKPRS